MTISDRQPALIGFAAWSGTGKTTLLEKIIPLLSAKGLRVGVIKHAHHDFDIDQKGKDSFKLRKAGAVDTIVASGKRWALIHENENENENENEKDQAEPDLQTLLMQLKSHPLDIILVEGFKHEAIPRIELRRETLNKPLLYPEDNKTIAIATESSDKMPHPITTLDINEPVDICNFIAAYFSLS